MRLHSPAITGSLTLSGSAVSTGNLTVGGLLNVEGSNGFAIGSLSDVKRIDSAGDSNNTFRFLSAAGQLTGIKAKQALFSDDILTSTGNVSGSVISTGSFGDGRFAGKVAIGTQRPISPLHLRFTDNSTNAFDNSSLTHKSGIYINNESTTNESYGGIGFRSHNVDGALALVYEGSDNTGRFTFNMEGSEKFVIKSTGDVGIGTSSPGENLHVSASGRTSLRLEGIVTSNGVISDVQFFNSTDSVAAINVNRVSNNDQADMTFHTQPNGGSVTERMRIDALGNVGIGVVPDTTWLSTRTALQVGGSGCLFGREAAGTGGDIRLGENVYQHSGGSYRRISGDEVSMYSQTNGTHTFGVAGSSTDNSTISFTDAMHIDNSGNVGIGTTSPEQLLHISASSGANAIALIGSQTADKYSYIGFRVSGTDYNVGVGGSTTIFPNQFYLYDATNAQTKLTLGGTETDLFTNLTVHGNITARTLIISSSVTNLTTQFASGSTRFGDDTTDTHEITGSLLVSSSINSTQFRTGNVIFPDGDQNNPSIRFAAEPDTGIARFGGDRVGFISNSTPILATTAAGNYEVILRSTTRFGWKSDGQLNTGSPDTYFDRASAGVISTNSSISGSVTSTGSFGQAHIAGRLGIGTNAPIRSLDIYDGNANAFLNLRDSAGNFDVGTATQHMVRFYEGGDVRMTISGSDVGIGTSSPSQKLEVAGAALINNGSSNHHLYFGNTSYGIHVVHSTGVMNFVSNDSTRFSIKNGGDVNVVGWVEGNGNNALFSSTGTGTLLQAPSTTEKIFFRDLNGNVGMTYDAANKRLGIGDAAQAQAPSFPLTVSKITSDPVAFFGYSQVNQEDRHGLIVIQSGTIPQSGGDLSGEAGIIFRHSGGTGGVNFDGNAGSIKSLKMDTYAGTGQAHNRLVFSTTFNNTDSEKMTILDSGKVGIGTSNPTSTLQVMGNTTISGSDSSALDLVVRNHHGTGLSRVIAQNNNVAMNAQLVADDDNNVAYVGSSSGGSKFIKFVGATTNAYFDGGNFGVGNPAPVQPLTVTGNISGSGDLKMSGAISGSQLRASSTTSIEAPYYFQKADGYAITNGNAKTITVSSLAYGAFDLHTGGYGNGERWNVHVSGGGLMTGGSGPHYDVTVLANQSTSNVTVSLTSNNGSYVVQITNNSGNTMYASYKFCSTNYTNFNHASVELASV